MLNDTFKEVRRELREAWGRSAGGRACAPSRAWGASEVTSRSHAVQICMAACGLTGALFHHTSWPADSGSGHPESSEDSGPCAEALIAQWLGLDEEVAG